MTPIGLIAFGLIWLLAVILWLRLAPASFGYARKAEGTAKRVVLIVRIYFFGLLYQVFVIGWLVPLVFGTYRLVRHR